MSLIYGPDQVKAWDAYTIEHSPISSLDLMERAAIACCKKLIGSYAFESISLVCGKGNNGGDGLAIARILSERNYKVTVFICDYTPNSSADFAANLERLPTTVERIHLNEGDVINFESDLLVDCIFGAGLDRPIENYIAAIVANMNQSGIPIVSIDLPSGLYLGSNTENDLVNVIKAASTFSFQIPKLPFFFAEYAPFVGHFSVLNIGLSTEFKGPSLATYIDRTEIQLKPISDFSFKGTKGYLTVIAGSGHMIGAALLCCQAAFKTGCGYVGLISNKAALVPLATSLPEAIWIGENPTQVPNKTTAIAIGPGLGKSDLAKQRFKLALQFDGPLVIDADALNLLAEDPELINQLPKGSILTPHLGELKRLIGNTNRPEQLLEKQRAFSIKHGIYIVQKGAYSKLTTPSGNLYINSSGNVGMATAGMGDALTGIIGSFLAQGYSPQEAAINGVYFHGLAGDHAALRKGQIGLLTSDVIQALPAVLNGL
ncbi:MAG: NAD(P)H-hydrate dehydratase [Crocinitomix sp.]|nr:NAD(P)H-hydrate dehydratase [Crocinitomix sp.]